MQDSLVHLTYAGGDYDRTAALISGRIEPEGIRLNYLSLPSHETFWRMLQFQEFDASELSCANYFVLCSRGESPFVALPVFPSRTFRHSAIYINTESGIREPADLKGRKVGCAEYAMTAAVWVRAFLQDDFGVLPSDLRWVLGGLEQPGRRERIAFHPPPGVHIEQAPQDRSLVEMLEDGQVDALITPSIPSVFLVGSPRVARLFPDFQRVEADYYQRTGIFPIMHTVVLRRDVYDRYPWAAASLYKAFCSARDLALARLYDSDALRVSLSWTVAYLEQERGLRGQDPWPYGFSANRATLEALKRHLADQGLLERDFPLEQVFAPSTLESVRH